MLTHANHDQGVPTDLSGPARHKVDDLTLRVTEWAECATLTPAIDQAVECFEEVNSIECGMSANEESDEPRIASMASFSAFIVARGFRFPPRSTVTAN